MSLNFQVTIEKGLRSQLAQHVETMTKAPVVVSHLGNGMCLIAVQAVGEEVRNQTVRALEHAGYPFAAKSQD